MTKVMKKPAMIGSIGCLSESPMKFGNKTLSFNGTTLDLVRIAVRSGAKVGDSIKANFGAGFSKYELYSNPKDIRVGGIWARKS